MAESTGTKGTYFGEKADSPDEQLSIVRELLKSGELRTLCDNPVDIEKQGALLKRVTDSGNVEYCFLPPPEARGNTVIEPPEMYGLRKKTSSTGTDQIGVEHEAFLVDINTGMPKQGRGFDTERTPPNYALFSGASDTPEMLNDMMEYNLAPSTLGQLRADFKTHVADKVISLYENGAGFSQYALTPHEVTDNRLEKFPYVYNLVTREPTDSYKKFFGVSGLQYHRAIRKCNLTPDESLEFSAYAANRLNAFSWIFIAMSGSSPNLMNGELTEKLQDSHRLNNQEKNQLLEHAKSGKLGHSFRQICRVAGSVSGGTHLVPLPESDSSAILNQMDSMLRANKVSIPDRITGEHSNVRIRNTLVLPGEDTSPGTFETSVPDTLFREERVEAIAYLYDGIISILHNDWKDSNKDNSSPQNLLPRLVSKDGGVQISEDDLLRYRRIDFEVALYGINSHLELADGSYLHIKKAVKILLKELSDYQKIPVHVVNEVKKSFINESPGSLTKDELNLPSLISFNQGKASSISSVAQARHDEILSRNPKIKPDEYKNLMMVDSARSLYTYVKRTL